MNWSNAPDLALQTFLTDDGLTLSTWTRSHFKSNAIICSSLVSVYLCLFLVSTSILSLSHCRFLPSLYIGSHSHYVPLCSFSVSQSIFLFSFSLFLVSTSFLCFYYISVSSLSLSFYSLISLPPLSHFLVSNSNLSLCIFWFSLSPSVLSLTSYSPSPPFLSVFLFSLSLSLSLSSSLLLLFKRRIQTMKFVSKKKIWIPGFRYFFENRSNRVPYLFPSLLYFRAKSFLRKSFNA